MQSKQEIEHEIVADRYWVEVDEQLNTQQLKVVRTAIPLCNVIDWEEINDLHEDAPTLTAVVLPYETKFVNISFDRFHKTMKNYRKNGRDQKRWSISN